MVLGSHATGPSHSPCKDPAPAHGLCLKNGSSGVGIPSINNSVAPGRFRHARTVALASVMVQEGCLSASRAPRSDVGHKLLHDGSHVHVGSCSRVPVAAEGTVLHTAHAAHDDLCSAPQQVKLPRKLYSSAVARLT